jgi:hypothetical protein
MSRVDDAEVLMETAPVRNRIQLLLDVTIRRVLTDEPEASLEVQWEHVISRVHDLAPGYVLDDAGVLNALRKVRAA